MPTSSTGRVQEKSQITTTKRDATISSLAPTQPSKESEYAAMQFDESHILRLKKEAEGVHASKEGSKLDVDIFKSVKKSGVDQRTLISDYIKSMDEKALQQPKRSVYIEQKLKRFDFDVKDHNAMKWNPLRNWKIYKKNRIKFQQQFYKIL